jgi:peptide/nickel transport system ATP-binding protein
VSRLLEVTNLSVDLPTAKGPLHAVQQVSFSVDRGETLCIVGESGCGKSMTALAIMDLLPPAAVRRAEALTFDGQDLSKRRNGIADLRGSRISMIFQEPMTSLNPVFTIGDQLTTVFRVNGKGSRAQGRERALYLLDRVGIANARQRLGQYPHELSGGLRQRVMIAMALMCGPDLIVADEPTTALDVTVQAELLHLMVELQQEFGMGLILITHDLGIVSRIADRICVMYAGQVVESGDPAQIFGQARHPYTNGLMRCLPSNKSADDEHLATIRGTVPSLVGQLRGCRFRDRCELAEPACNDEISLFAHPGGHLARCIVTAKENALVSRA